MSKQELTIRQEGTHVYLLVSGQAIADIPWDAALELAKAIFIQAKKAEELAKALDIVQDQAILIRSGFPVSLTANPDINAEALKEAQTNRDLRRYIPIPGIRSGEDRVLARVGQTEASVDLARLAGLIPAGAA